MADIDELVSLLERWRDSSGVGRLGVAVDATRAIRALSPTAKRELAAEVAERVAPQLVPQIRAEEGDLTAEQLSAVVDLLRRADREQLDDLVTALRSGDVDASLQLVDDAIDAVAPVVPDAATDALEARIADADAQVDAVLDDAVAALRDGDGPPPPPGEVEIDEEAVRAAAEAAAAERAARWADTSRIESSAPIELRTARFDIAFDDVELPDPTVEEVAPLEERLDQLPGAAATDDWSGGSDSSRHRSAASLSRDQRRPVGTLAAAPTPAVVAAITATPDGYRRRRAAMAALRDGRLEPDHVAPVVASLARDTDRSWVAGAALDAGLIRSTHLEELPLTATARRRLARRADPDG